MTPPHTTPPHGWRGHRRVQADYRAVVYPERGALMADRKHSPGYLWRPGSSPQDNPLQIVVTIVIGLVIVGAVVLALVT